MRRTITTMTFWNQREWNLKVAEHRKALHRQEIGALFLLSLPTLLGVGSGFWYGYNAKRGDHNAQRYKNVVASELLWQGGRDVSVGILCFSLHCLFAKWYLSGLSSVGTRRGADIHKVELVMFESLVRTSLYVSSYVTSTYSFYQIGKGSMECRMAYQHKYALNTNSV